MAARLFVSFLFSLVLLGLVTQSAEGKALSKRRIPDVGEILVLKRPGPSLRLPSYPGMEDPVVLRGRRTQGQAGQRFGQDEMLEFWEDLKPEGGETVVEVERRRNEVDNCYPRCVSLG